MDRLANARGMDVPQRQSEVSEELQALGRMISGVSEQIDMLDSRLIVVSRQPTPPPPTNKTGVERVLVPVAEEIRSFRFRLEGCIERLSDMRERLEV